MNVKCEASVMAVAHFSDYSGDVEPCDQEGVVDVLGYMLCGPCEDALRHYVEICRRKDAP